MPRNNRLDYFLPKIRFLLRLFFGFILIYASLDKLLHPVQFALAVENYRLISSAASRWVAIWLPYLELLTGLLLMSGFWEEAAGLTTTLLMGIFFIAIFQAYLRGLDISCGCFSVDGDANLGVGKVLENLALLIGSIILVVLQHRRPTIQPPQS